MAIRKISTKILFTGIILCFFTHCKQGTARKEVPTIPEKKAVMTNTENLSAMTNNVDQGSIQPKNPEKKLSEEDRMKLRVEQNRVDSIRLEKALRYAMEKAKNEFGSDKFTAEYRMQPDDSSYSIHIEIVIGRLFSDDNRYFLLRRHVPSCTYINLFQLVDNKPKQVIFREQGGMTYLRDTIADINGDGAKDFLVHWYPSAGCCRRNIYTAYLHLSDDETFTSDYEFINPTFAPKERIIRGIEYGHPGEVGLYKYKWNGLQIDTIEFIYPDVNHKGQFIKTKKPAYHPSEKNGTVLTSIPEEYRHIESIDWFMDF